MQNKNNRDIIWNLLSRMKDDHLHDFLNPVVINTLRYYDENLAIPSKIRNLIFSKIPKEEMLRDTKMRNRLIDAMNTNDAIKLSHKLVSNKGENPFQNLKSLKIRKNSNNEKILFENLGVEHLEIALSEKLPDITNIEPYLKLFPHQRTAIVEIESFLEDSHRALLHMPTGSGKTVTSMRVISNMFIKNTPLVVIWLALTEELCEQAINEFDRTWKAVGDRPIPAYRFFKHHTPDILQKLDENPEAFIVASMSKLDNVKEDQFMTTLADYVKLIVMDEAHHAIAKTYKDTINILKKHTKTMLLGLSATPGRSSEQASQVLADFFGKNRARMKTGNQNPVRYLINEEYISEPDIEIIDHKTKLTNADLDLLKKSQDIPQRILDIMSADLVRNVKIVNTVNDLIENHNQKRILVFTTSIQNSRNISMILSAKNFNSYYVDSRISDQRRAKIIKEFKGDSKRPIIICNVNVLTTGFDAPQTSAVVIARPTKSLVLYSQMFGRCLRGPKVGGAKKSFIRIISDRAIVEYTDIVRAFEKFESHWGDRGDGNG
ncbi:MAG: DEAD/DEAH box helicase family protein [Alphaproteobacteria bacterium]|nr:DEAD/DEAH box helicase family protein [Alphaproteobacteria bacterium]